MVFVAAFDFFGDLHYLLLLQRLGYLDEVGGLSSQDGFVDIPDSVEAHDPVPFLGLGEHLEGLGLFEEWGELLRMVAVRDPEEYSAVVGRSLENLQVARARDKTVVVVVCGPAKGVISDVNLSASLQQLYLVGHAPFRESLDRFRDLDLVAPERDVLPDQFHHPLLYRRHVLVGDGVLPVSLVDPAEIALRDGPAEDQLAVREYVLRRLVEQETQRTAVVAASDVGAVVHELHVPVVEYPELQAFGNVVDLCGKDVIGFVEIEFSGDLLEGGAFLELLEGTRVLAIDVNHAQI